jgi:hypothetical protein
MTMTLMSPQQVIKTAFDEATQSLKALLIGTSQISIAANDAGTGDTIRVYSALEPVGYNAVTYTLSGANTIMTEVYKTGGVAGTTVGTITRTYTDNTRTVLVSVVRS